MNIFQLNDCIFEMSDICCLCSATQIAGFIYSNGKFVCGKCLVCAKCGCREDPLALVENHILCEECVIQVIREKMISDHLN